MGVTLVLGVIGGVLAAWAARKVWPRR
jgi:hypothetical protein